MKLELRRVSRSAFFDGVTVAWAVGVLFYALAVAAAFILTREGYGITLCPFRLAFGLPCPLCGGTRTGFAMVSGRWADALEINPLVTLGTVTFVSWAALWLLFGLRASLRLSPSQTVSLILLLLALNWAYVLHHFEQLTK